MNDVNALAADAPVSGMKANRDFAVAGPTVNPLNVNSVYDRDGGWIRAFYGEGGYRKIGKSGSPLSDFAERDGDIAIPDALSPDIRRLVVGQPNQYGDCEVMLLDEGRWMSMTLDRSGRQHLTKALSGDRGNDGADVSAVVVDEGHEFRAEQEQITRQSIINELLAQEALKSPFGLTKFDPEVAAAMILVAAYIERGIEGVTEGAAK